MSAPLFYAHPFYLSFMRVLPVGPPLKIFHSENIFGCCPASRHPHYSLFFFFAAHSSINFIACVRAFKEVNQFERIVGGSHPLGRV